MVLRRVYLQRSVLSHIQSTKGTASVFCKEACQPTQHNMLLRQASQRPGDSANLRYNQSGAQGFSRLLQPTTKTTLFALVATVRVSFAWRVSCSTCWGSRGVRGLGYVSWQPVNVDFVTVAEGSRTAGRLPVFALGDDELDVGPEIFGGRRASRRRSDLDLAISLLLLPLLGVTRARSLADGVECAHAVGGGRLLIVWARVALKVACQHA